MNSEKKSLYLDLISQLEHYFATRGMDLLGAMSIVVNELKECLPSCDWVGFYLNKGEDLLVIGPYAGHLPCFTIPFSKGQCGLAARTRETQILRDVSEAHDYIACSADTKSEIVVPLFNRKSALLGVLDLDSDQIGAFSEVDAEYLAVICRKLGDLA